jgi:general secretion pathway protein H
MWGPGSSATAGPKPGRQQARGFTLIELMVVVALVALTTGLVSLAVRDPQSRQLEREAARLVALLESARTEARSSSLEAQWQPQRRANPAEDGPDFRFVGLPASLALPTRWLDGEVWAEVIGGRSVRLGPEPLIGAQRIVLHLGDQRLVLATDGLGPFTVAADAVAASP